MVGQVGQDCTDDPGVISLKQNFCAGVQWEALARAVKDLVTQFTARK